MKVLVTGANGFVGTHLCRRLESEGHEVFRYDIDSTPADLRQYCTQADFVYNLAGVMRPTTSSEFYSGNSAFSSTLLDTLAEYGNRCPVMLASSIQATLLGRFAGSDYGKSKYEAEQAFIHYGANTGAKVLIYRFPNLFGEGGRPNYNSVVATFCYNTAHGLPLQINDPAVDLELLYVGDLIDELMLALRGAEHRCRFEGTQAVEDHYGEFCYTPITFHITVGSLADTLRRFPESCLSDFAPESLERRLYNTYQSYLPQK